MTVILYNNASAPNVVNKSLTVVDTLNGVLRSPTSIIDPIITLERGSPTGFNYFQIPEFNRYYYVNGVSSEFNNIIAISGHVDVLKTYEVEIKNFDAIIKRQENRFNLYLDDGIFKAYQDTKHKTIAFPNGFNNSSYILALAGNS